MRVLIACEFSGIVRDAFLKRGHDAWSCDIIPSESKRKKHLELDVREVLLDHWDLMIAHPPCTRLTVAGARWFKGREKEQRAAIAFCEMLWFSEVEKIALENPIGVLSTQSDLGKPTQIIQPWQFGHGETKATCLWLKNLPKLEPTKVVAGRVARVHLEPPGPNRWKNRSRTFQGIADAMAAQWG
jgi:site-specific DNA-cytosine methylase